MALLALFWDGFGLIIAIVSGLSFGSLMALFTVLSSSQLKPDHPSFEAEILLKDGPANHFVRAEGVGGWLYLTNKRVLFRSHSINIQTHEWTVPLTGVTHVESVRTLWIIPNGLLIVTPNRKERFVVEDRSSWVAAILSAK